MTKAEVLILIKGLEKLNEKLTKEEMQEHYRDIIQELKEKN